MAPSNHLMWKLKGSTGQFNHLSTVTLPCQVSVVREKLKVNFGLSESTHIDFVVYLESDPDAVLSDQYTLKPNSRVYTRRCTAEEASLLIAEANSVYVPDDDLEEETFGFEDEGDMDELFKIPESLPEEENQSADKKDEEESRIRELIQQQKTHESGRPQVQLEYYKKMAQMPPQNYQSNVPNTQTSNSNSLAPSPYDTTDTSYLSQNYICHMCGQRGHNIKDCTVMDGKRLSKKIRPSTGIPTDFLTPIPSSDVPKYDEVYILKDGSFAIMREIESVSGGAFFTKTVDQRIQTQLGISEKDAHSLSKGFKCTICLCYFNNPVTTLCCGETFCLDCIIGKKNPTFNTNIVCPTCRKSIKMTDLQSNTSLKKAVQSLILGNVDVLKNVNKEKETKKEPEKEEKVQKFCGINIESLKRYLTYIIIYLQAKDNG
ncbi:uncharacterized protein TA12675 [Theileria annulata]|uniref:Uncharacterized protein n=1 Tax=Theileria annulata TaxID=5874 RepID=Q4UE51_THEAN|nr:uncharacterized protein TA12675 [Theileria annulata]CAI74638.1 hypothetical protein, conserved [Theileria annulata]|eukprot:XP_952370.1 hypothetical protein, conserved [Theileria annulata]